MVKNTLQVLTEYMPTFDLDGKEASQLIEGFCASCLVYVLTRYIDETGHVEEFSEYLDDFVDKFESGQTLEPHASVIQGMESWSH